ncbi:hypothetical protein L3X38_034437 [Prunus dulcis]|uniref:Uncharacterized protein n=1 Tax=Prunus dulcis TaxID=3755 RepID=A0AAD4VJ92_PRUDU|nr:hypothetical protein L3X38_034437 [Prunus dulcis]
MLRNQHLRKGASSGIAGRNAQRKERLRLDRLKGLEEKMSRILKGVKDVHNLNNSLCAQNEILQENQAELVGQVHAQREPELTSTKSTGGASSSSTTAETPRRNLADAKNILKEKKAWRERNKRLVRNLCKEKNWVGLEETEEEVDGITSKLRDLVLGTPFINMLYPFSVSEQGIETKVEGQPIIFRILARDGRNPHKGRSPTLMGRDFEAKRVSGMGILELEKYLTGMGRGCYWRPRPGT